MPIGKFSLQSIFKMRFVSMKTNQKMYYLKQNSGCVATRKNTLTKTAFYKNWICDDVHTSKFFPM